MNEYSTLGKVKAYLGLDSGAASADASADDELLGFIRTASRDIDQATRRRFYPRVETRFYSYKEPRKIRLDDDLLSLSTLKTSNGACTIASGVMWLACGDEWNLRPADRIILKNDSGSQLNFSGTIQRANEVTGYWGYHEDWDNAWIDTGASLAVAYTASGLLLELAGGGSYGAGASDVLGDHPRISPGDLLKIQDEYFNVLGPGSAGNLNIKVRPYVNGTTAAAHASGASIAKFSPEPDIEWCTRRLTAWMWAQKDAPYTEKTGNTQTGEFTIPSSWPPDVKNRLARFVHRKIAFYPDGSFEL